MIAERVAETVRGQMPESGKLLVGVSGGGDSNAMLYALSQLAGEGLTIHPVLIKGIPDWDLGVPRAQELCATYGLSLTIMEDTEVEALLGIAPGGASLIDRWSPTPIGKLKITCARALVRVLPETQSWAKKRGSRLALAAGAG